MYVFIICQNSTINCPNSLIIGLNSTVIYPNPTVMSFYSTTFCLNWTFIDSYLFACPFPKFISIRSNFTVIYPRYPNLTNICHLPVFKRYLPKFICLNCIFRIWPSSASIQPLSAQINLYLSNSNHFTNLHAFFYTKACLTTIV